MFDKNKNWIKTQRYLSILFSNESLVFIIFLECGIIVFYNSDLYITELSNLRNAIITSTSVFSAIIIGLIIQGINKHTDIIQTHKKRLEELSFKLTTLRRFLHYLVNSESIWGKELHRDFLRKLIKLYPQVNMNVSSYSMKESNSLFPIVSDERYEYKTTKLFLSFLTIVDIRKHEHMKLVTSSTKFNYTNDKLIYMYESFNNLWYFLAHKRAAVEFSEDNFNIIFLDDFSKQLKILFGDDKTISDLNNQMIIDIGNEFYNETIPEMFDHLNFISKGVPNLLKFLSIELTLVLLIGLFVPMFSFLIQELFLQDLMKISVFSLVFVYGLIIYHLSKIIYVDSKK